MSHANSFLTALTGILAAVSIWSFRPAPPPAIPAPTAALAVPSAKQTQPATMHTSGTAVIRVQPDKVTLRLGVETYGTTPRGSRADNAQTVEAVLRALRDAGVPPQDISTDYFSIQPEYDHGYTGPKKVVGYWTNNAVVVMLRQVDRLSDVVAAALEAGATTIDDVQFTTTRMRELRDQARAEAVKAAMEKAQGIASAAGLSVGEITSIDENSWSYYYGMWSSRDQYLANVQQNVSQVASSSGAPALEDGEFSLGQMVVQARVDLGVTLK